MSCCGTCRWVNGATVPIQIIDSQQWSDTGAYTVSAPILPRRVRADYLGFHVDFTGLTVFIYIVEGDKVCCHHNVLINLTSRRSSSNSRASIRPCGA